MNPFQMRMDAIHTDAKQMLQQAEEIVNIENTLDPEKLRRISNEMEVSTKRLAAEFKLYMENSETAREQILEITGTQIKGEKLNLQLKELLRKEKQEQVSNHTSKLPKLQLPSFDGNILKFHDFWDRFQSSVAGKEMNACDKLSYLLGCLQGPALEALKGLGPTNKNYDVAIAILRERYGDKELLIDAHYTAMNNLKKASTITECRNTLNTIEKHLRILGSLGENVEGNHFRAILTSKFPEDIVLKLNLMVNDKKLSTLRKGLAKIITAMEMSNNQEPIHQAEISTASLHVRTKDQEGEKGKRGFKRKLQYTKENRKIFPDNSAPKKPRKGCLLCNGEHYASNCREVKDINEKKKKLGNRCYRCLKVGHTANDCTAERRCYFCRSTTHHEILCNKSKPCSVRVESNTCQNIGINKHETFLQTGVVAVATANNSTSSLMEESRVSLLSRPCRILMDSGSQRSYVTAKLAKELGLRSESDETLLIYTFGNKSPQEINSPTVELKITTRRGINKKITANIVPHITSKVPVPTLPKNAQIDLVADDGSAGEEIHLLIGNDYYFSFIREEKKILSENLFLVNTDCGWMLSGKTQGNENALAIVTYCQDQGVETDYLFTADVPLREFDVRFLWSLESIGISDSPKISRDEETINYFNETVKYENGRYHVKWPWIKFPPELTSNFGMAYGRLSSLWKRLGESDKLEYDTIIKEQIQLGIVEEIEPNITNNPVHYLPHHLVKQEGKRGRIVYDASAKVKGQKSLNENMYRGPAMIEDLIALLLQFRVNKIGITADVEKAFLAVGLQPEDRDVTRFLWLKDPKKGVTENNIIQMRFCRVPFGIVVSPFILTATIQYHFMKNKDQMMREITQKFYVDNLVTGADTTDDALKMIKKVRDELKAISMNIRDWNSNDENVMKNLPEECRSKDVTETKVLGLTWVLKEDILKLRPSRNLQKEIPKTKRELMCAMASVYDPCGLVAPLVLPAKLLVQELWRKKFKWDKTLPEEMGEQLKTVFYSLKQTKEVEVPRFTGLLKAKEPEYELHGFTDASNAAFAATVYLKVVDKTNGNCTVNLIMAKCRVTPITHKEDLKIPKLELLGYLIGKRLLCYVKTAMKMPIKRLFLWTDSQIILHWMKSEKLLPPFVARRVTEIKQQTEIIHRYVNTHLNPADLATRPELWEEKKEMWFNGPDFLRRKEDTWPAAPSQNEVSLQVVAEGLDCNLEECEEVEQEEILRNDSPEDIEITEMDSMTEIRKLQKTHFPEEIRGKETSLKRNLGLFMDVDGVLRCQGRITNTSCGYDVKHPILIPRGSKFTECLIKHIHEKNKHVGANHTLSLLRQKYWIPGGKGTVQKVIRKCIQCVKHMGGPYKLPPTPALPSERANYSAPFTYTGMDYLGPIMVEGNGRTEKVWVCLYTCLAVRAIHLEIVKNLTADECLMALRRFIATRGIPEVMVSDNAQQFHLTAQVLSDRYCIENKIRWRFIVQLAPWRGGFYERLVGLVKNCLKKTLGKQLLNETQLHTVIKEIEAVVGTHSHSRNGSHVDTRM